MHRHSLLTDNGRVAGAFAYWRETGRLIVFKAKSIVIATGGIGKAWRITSNSWNTLATAWLSRMKRAPSSWTWNSSSFIPPEWFGRRRPGILVTEAVRGEGGILRNKAGERFMEKYDPSAWNFPRATSLPAPSTQK